MRESVERESVWSVASNSSPHSSKLALEEIALRGSGLGHIHGQPNMIVYTY